MADPQPSRVRSIDDLRGPAGHLEALLNTGSADAPYNALICHPHPSGGGTLHNKVVYNAMKVFTGFGLPVLRFNFRGTGLSEGTHDDGIGEQDDVRAALDWLTHEFARPILVCGFSFGAHVALRACCADQQGPAPRVAGLIALGLPIAAERRIYDYAFLPQCTPPKLFLSGDSDPYAAAGDVTAVWQTAAEPKASALIPGADHFFQGTPASPTPKLAAMQEHMRTWLRHTFDLL